MHLILITCGMIILILVIVVVVVVVVIVVVITIVIVVVVIIVVVIISFSFSRTRDDYKGYQDDLENINKFPRSKLRLEKSVNLILCIIS